MTASPGAASSYSIDSKCEAASSKVEELLGNFRKDGTAEKVWSYIAGDLKKDHGGWEYVVLDACTVNNG